MLDWSGRKVVVLGLGDTGLSMTRWLARRGADVRVAHTPPEPAHAGRRAAEPPRGTERAVPVAGYVELFAQALKALIPPKVLAVTGTNGKSTVTAMTGEICRAAGRETVVAGHIGTPVL